MTAIEVVVQSKTHKLFFGPSLQDMANKLDIERQKFTHSYYFRWSPENTLRGSKIIILSFQMLWQIYLSWLKCFWPPLQFASRWKICIHVYLCSVENDLWGLKLLPSTYNRKIFKILIINKKELNNNLVDSLTSATFYRNILQFFSPSFVSLGWDTW